MSTATSATFQQQWAVLSPPFSRSELIQLKEVVGPYAYLCGTNVNNVIHSSPVYLMSVHTTASIPIGDDFDKNMILKAITVVD